MLHRNKNKQLSRVRNQRTALIKALAVSLIKYGKIKTTEVKAKVLKPFVEKLITRGKDGDLSSIRLIAKKVGMDSAQKVVKDISPKYKSRNGGYTRVTKLKTRLSDASRMAQIEFV